MSTCLSFNWPVAVLVNGTFAPLNASCTNRAITCWAVYNNTKSTVQVWRHDDDDDSGRRVTWHMIILPCCRNLGFQLCCITKRRHTSLPSSAKSFVVWLFFRYGSDFAWSTKEDGKHLKIEDFTDSTGLNDCAKHVPRFQCVPLLLWPRWWRIKYPIWLLCLPQPKP